jgi:hypothetical protein
MAINLGVIARRVRLSLSDIPKEFISDKQIMVELEKARAFCDAVSGDDVSEDLLSKCYESLASYYSYINYTTLSERQLGTLPPTSKIRLDALRRVAIAFIQLISTVPITDELLIDDERLMNTSSAMIKMTPSVIDDG